MSEHHTPPPCTNPASRTPAGLTAREAELLAALVTARQMLKKAQSMLQPGVFDQGGMKQVNAAIRSNTLKVKNV